MLPGLVAGTGIGFGLWLVVRGLYPAPPPLTAALADLERPRWPDTGPTGTWHHRTSVWATTVVEAFGADLEGLRHDLAVVGRTLERHGLDKLTMATLGLGLPVVFTTIVALGGVTIPPVLVGVVALGGAVGGFVYPDLALRSEAAARRRDFRHALGAYLDLVTVILAGGGGVESALDAAANTGSGWAFARIRQALAVSRLNRESPWAVLNRMSDDLAVPELGELASSVGLAGDSGAKVRQSLTAKAASMRDHELTDAHAAAESATERMAAPVVVMLTGFILLIGYPAVANVLTL